MSGAHRREDGRAQAAAQKAPEKAPEKSPEKEPEKVSRQSPEPLTDNSSLVVLSGKAVPLSDGTYAKAGEKITAAQVTGGTVGAEQVVRTGGAKRS